MRSQLPPTHRQVLTPELLLAAYSKGLFPMARSRRDPFVDWYSPAQRAILPFENFCVPRSLRAAVRNTNLTIRKDTAFERVIRACARPRRDHPDTWINNAIIDAYSALHLRGFAHSVEAWNGDDLVGGLYGIAIRGAFFGESMFHRPDLGGTNASKICLFHLVEHLQQRRFTLLDVQINSAHMAKFGTIEVSRTEYDRLLRLALSCDTDWHAAPMKAADSFDTEA